MNGKEILNFIDSEKTRELFISLYGEDSVEITRQRCRILIGELQNESLFPKREFPETERELRLFSVPGRTELGGNHTDHNNGKVLAASIHLDAVAAVSARQDKQVFFRSAGHRDIRVDLTDLSIREEEKGDTEALVRGIAAEFTARGTPVGGFTANAVNTVLTGSGLSSSATVEVLIAKIFDNFYCGGKRDSLELAKIAQKAENVYFGKPCGLMDQTACATGGAVAIDFQDLQNPGLKKINFDPAAAGYALCVVNTKGSHSDLTPDYAAIPAEMKAVAAFFGKSVLREVDEEIFMKSLPELRKAAGDRAVLRALHFFGENKRVGAMLAAMEGGMETYLALVRKSGDSSLELLQNIYSPKNHASQGLGLALALTKNFLGGKGACRVHGGGFAGTIQAYIPLQKLENYKVFMEELFGKGALTVLRIRPMGAIEINFTI